MGERLRVGKEKCAVCELRKGMINIDSLIKAKQFKSMHIILNGKNDNWNYIGKWWLKKV